MLDAAPQTTRYVIAPSADAGTALRLVAVVSMFALFSAAAVYATLARAAYVPSMRMFRDMLLDDYAASVAELQAFVEDAVERAPARAREPFTTLSPEPLSSGSAEYIAPVAGALAGARDAATAALAAGERWLTRASLRAYSTGNTIRASRAPPGRRI